MIFDAHIHHKNHENGGFLIGLEGKPVFNGTLTNSEVLAFHRPEDNYFSFYYITASDIDNLYEHKLLKYHPRRERYSPDQVSKSIGNNHPMAVIIDTLNEPYWTAYDYWKIARDNADTPIIMAHSGGYLINDFIKMCHFQPNVWIDFALTHTTLGKLGDLDEGLGYVNDAIKYALHSPFRNKILLSSDYPFFDQDAVFEYYKDYHELLNGNYLTFVKEYLI